MANFKANAGDAAVKIESSGPYHISIEVEMDEQEFLQKNDLHSEEEFNEVKKERDKYEEELSEWKDKVYDLDNEIADLKEQIRNLESQIAILEDK
jgi:chromosome segregation ATPase